MLTIMFNQTSAELVKKAETELMNQPKNGLNRKQKDNRNWKCLILLEQRLLFYYMANPVFGKSLCSDWFFLGQDFAVRTVSVEMVQSVYFCFEAKPANSKFETKTAKKKFEYCHSSH